MKKELIAASLCTILAAPVAMASQPVNHRINSAMSCYGFSLLREDESSTWELSYKAGKTPQIKRFQNGETRRINGTSEFKAELKRFKFGHYKQTWQENRDSQDH